MELEEQVEEGIHGDDLGVKSDLHGLGVAGQAGADLFVGGVLGLAAGVTGEDFFDTFDAEKGGIKAPEASSGNSNGFHGGFFRFGSFGGTGRVGEESCEQGEDSEEFHGITGLVGRRLRILDGDVNLRGLLTGGRDGKFIPLTPSRAA